MSCKDWLRGGGNSLLPALALELLHVRLPIPGVTPLGGDITAPIDLLLSQEVASVRSRRAQLFHMGIH